MTRKRGPPTVDIHHEATPHRNRPSAQGQSKGKKRHTVNDVMDYVTGQQSRIHTLEGTVEGIGSKLDIIIAGMSASTSSLPAHHDTPARRESGSSSACPITVPATANNPLHAGPPHTGPQLNDQPLPAPHVLRREENREGLIDRLVMREDYRANTSTQGKNHHLHDIGIAKPYMYVEREGIQTLKQKLDVRASLSALEYLNAMIVLLHDTSAYDPNDFAAMFKHVMCVATDALARPWPGVRKWSQYIWDAVDKGRCRWSDAGFIQEERVRISYTNGPPAPNPSIVKNTPSAQHLESVLCRDFNSASGCRHSASHDEGHLRVLHVCAYCDPLGRRSNHSYHRCRFRLEAMGQHTSSSNAHHLQGDHRPWQQAPRHSSQGYTGAGSLNSTSTGRGHNTNHSSFPKNG